MSKQINIGIVTALMENNYFGTIIKGICKGLFQANVRVYIVNTFMIYDHSFRDIDAHKYYSLSLNHMDGWIVLPQGARSDYIHKIYGSGKPVVLINKVVNVESCTVIKDDGYHGAKSAVDHLIGHGHDKIAFVGWLEAEDVQERLQGYKACLMENQLPFRDDLVFYADVGNQEGGKDVAYKILDTGVLFTAVFVANDLMAIGLMEVFQEAGYRVPDHIAIIGYDNTSFAKNARPGLSSVHQDIYSIGARAAQTLLQRIQQNAVFPDPIVTGSKLITRISCGCQNSENECSNLDIDSFDYYKNAVNHSHHLGTKLIQASVEEIKSLILDIPQNPHIRFLGFWDHSNQNANDLKIEQVLNSIGKQVLSTPLHCSIEDFPPEDIFQNIYQPSCQDVIYIHPIRFETKELGVLAYVSPFDEYCDKFDVDFSPRSFEFLSFAFEREAFAMEIQQKTIQSEKMTALSRMIAGVAHEMNTPMGVGLSASTFLENKLKELDDLFSNGNMKRSDLTNYINVLKESAFIITNNLQKAVQLISSFKQVSADQSSEQRRIFNIRKYIEQIILTLSPTLKKTSHHIQIICQDDIEINSFPGAISQIFTNFIMNSMIHAFEPNDKGQITIEVRKEINKLYMRYSDNGKGIEKDLLNKIYEPFFTSKRDSGGTGLGLNIIYNIVTKTLNGTITCSSEVNKGTTFMIEIVDEIFEPHEEDYKT